MANKIIKNLSTASLMAVFLMAFIFVVYVRYTNIDMTEMRLFLAYLPQWLTLSACFVVTAAIYARYSDGKS